MALFYGRLFAKKPKKVGGACKSLSQGLGQLFYISDRFRLALLNIDNIYLYTYIISN